MHILPVYYTTTNHKKRKAKRVTEKMQSALDAHEKFLKKKGYKGSSSSSKSKTVTFTRQTPKYPSLSNGAGGVALKKETPKYTGDAVIGQAYNKGNLVVLSKSESSESSTGKRR